MRRDKALELFARHIADNDIVVAVYQTLFDWLQINPRDLDYVATGAMGQASSHGLGLALANPGRNVIILDGDGSLLMNLGSLVTIGENYPENLFHFVFVNGTYEVNGRHPVPGGKQTDFALIASSCGYRVAHKVQTLGELKTILPKMLSERGPAFGAIDIEPGESHPMDYEYIHSKEARSKFRQALNDWSSY